MATGAVINNHRDREAAFLKDITNAIRKEELLIYLQPQVNTVNGEVTGAEALVRWLRPGSGLLTPDYFVPQLEKSGRTTELTLWVLEACMVLSRNQIQTKKIQISVNLSVHDLEFPGFVLLVESLLDRTGAQAIDFCLEMTESSIMHDLEKCLTSISRLRQLGFTFSIDDFGIGYSSLFYLSKLPIDELKIDRSFVERLHEPKQCEILKAIIQLGLVLKLRLVAEGVEDLETYELLAHLGCQEIQGYLIAKPMLAIEFFVWLSACNGYWRNCAGPLAIASLR
ncbi:EAL domain-containing protein [Pseudomonas sp. GL93]|uniref:EAL domain-containing protein n=1 Tax=Pseudomonas sp. GL93 TaxID=2014741 RepID=UPI001401CB15|nr:EAL domain-containing protein [Pseudomonas sp. GL93]